MLSRLFALCFLQPILKDKCFICHSYLNWSVLHRVKPMVNNHSFLKLFQLAIFQQFNLKYCLTFVCYRVKHLNWCGDLEENIEKYLQCMKEVDIDWEKIGQKVETKFVREKAKA